jgi:myo-inositol-1(or 4)-monophosphatase
VRATSGVRRAGSAALDLADVADGRFDAFWELIDWDDVATRFGSARTIDLALGT